MWWNVCGIAWSGLVAGLVFGLGLIGLGLIGLGRLGRGWVLLGEAFGELLDLALLLGAGGSIDVFG